MIRVFNKVIIGECAYLIRREIGFLYSEVVRCLLVNNNGFRIYVDSMTGEKLT